MFTHTHEHPHLCACTHTHACTHVDAYTRMHNLTHTQANSFAQAHSCTHTDNINTHTNPHRHTHRYMLTQKHASASKIRYVLLAPPPHACTNLQIQPHALIFPVFQSDILPMLILLFRPYPSMSRWKCISPSCVHQESAYLMLTS